MANERDVVVIDGANVAYEEKSGGGKPKLSNLLKVRRERRKVASTWLWVVLAIVLFPLVGLLLMLALGVFGAPADAVRRLEAIDPDPRLYPTFDEDLRRAFIKEMELYLDSILRERRSVVSITPAIPTGRPMASTGIRNRLAAVVQVSASAPATSSASAITPARPR